MRWFIAAAAALVLASQAHAQGAWPQRPVTLIVPFGAGGSADLTARVIAPHLQAKFGQPFVIDNKGGAGGSIGAGYVAKAANDGYTLLVGTISSNAINAALYFRLNYDLDRDFQFLKGHDAADLWKVHDRVFGRQGLDTPFFWDRSRNASFLICSRLLPRHDEVQIESQC